MSKDEMAGNDKAIVCPVAVAIMHQHHPCHCRRRRQCASKRGAGDDAKASSPALSLLSMHATSIDTAAAATAAIVWASMEHVMMPWHHRPPCCRRLCMSIYAAAVTAIAITQASKGQVMMPRHHHLSCLCCCHCRYRAGKIRDRC